MSVRKIYLEINGERTTLPLLRPFQAQISFPKTDINIARFRYTVRPILRKGEDPPPENPARSTCVFWSDEDFAWASFDLDHDLVDTFANANRLICYTRYDRFPMMVEDTSGNQVLLELEKEHHADEYYTAELKFPLDVSRAVPLIERADCRFRARKHLSPEFTSESVSEPFRAAVEVLCTRDEVNTRSVFHFRYRGNDPTQII